MGCAFDEINLEICENLTPSEAKRSPTVPT
jgi:hypothetical protein